MKIRAVVVVLAMGTACKSKNGAQQASVTTSAPKAKTASSGEAKKPGPPAVDKTPITSGPEAESGNVTGCSKAELFAGAPASDDTSPPKATGTPLKQAPALDWRQLAFVGSTIYTATGEEVWAVEGDTAKRVAGKLQEDGIASGPGACADARIAAAFGIVPLGDGSLVVADRSANLLLRVINPDDPAKCRVVVHAGPVPEKTGSIDPSKRPDVGDTDGPGAKARFNGPEWPVAGDDGSVYFLDAGNNKVKKVAGDADRTVSTVASLASFDRVADWKAMTLMGGDLYLVGNGATESWVLKIPTSGGAPTELVKKGGKDFHPIDENSIADLASITTDGKSLIVSGSGYIWRVDPKTGKISEPLAGAGIVPDFPPTKYDATAEMPAAKVILQLHSTDESKMGTTSFLAFHDGALWYTGDANSHYVEKISCP